MEDDLDNEAQQMESLLNGKLISKVFRPSENEICIQCKDGTRLFVEINKNGTLEFSVT